MIAIERFIDMTDRELLLRERLCTGLYINHDAQAIRESFTELYSGLYEPYLNFMSLYRYRCLNDYELKSLRKQTIFMRWPSTFQDPNDCKPELDIEGISDFIFEKNHKSISRSNRKAIEGTLLDDARVQTTLNRLRNLWMISCFTQRLDNEQMWEVYADGYRGICLIYDFEEIRKAITKFDHKIRLVPVRYGKTIYRLNRDDLCNPTDETVDKYRWMCVTKDRDEFSYEEEWRLIYDCEKPDHDSEIGKNVSFVNPKIILCGAAIDKSSANYKELLDIAADKNIAVFNG